MGELISLERARAARRPAPSSAIDHGALPRSARRVPEAVGVSGAERHDRLRVVGPGRRSERRAAESPAESRTASAERQEPLWREVSGGVLREERLRQRRTLADVAGRAGMSVQHLSEVERGRKEASSEMLAAAAGSLGLSLGEIARRCAFALAPAGAPGGPVLLAA